MIEQTIQDNKMAVHHSSATDEWETPQELFDVLHGEFNLTLDVCADFLNKKCLTYIDQDQDGLQQDRLGDNCWMNPPYGREIGKWMQKAHQTGEDGGLVVCLVPARTDTQWWWNHVIYAEIRFLKGRLKFGGHSNSAPFPSAIVIFRGRKPSVEWWNWK